MKSSPLAAAGGGPIFRVMFTHAKPLIIFAALSLTACSGAVGGYTASTNDNRHQCRDYDWFQVGIADGIRGYENVQGRFEALAANCTQHGAVIDEEDYMDGYAEGRTRAGA